MLSKTAGQRKPAGSVGRSLARLVIEEVVEATTGEAVDADPPEKRIHGTYRA